MTSTNLTVAVFSILAMIVGPISAVVVSVLMQQDWLRRQSKFNVLATLLATKHHPITEQQVQTFHTVDLIFFDKPEVRKLWREYFELLSNPALMAQWDTKRKELVNSIARAAGFGKAITYLDIERVYSPVGLNEQAARAEEISKELLRVLKGSGGINVLPKEAAHGEPPKPTEPGKSVPVVK